ncbi:hypothetical protein [Methylomicrobium lacus]
MPAACGGWSETLAAYRLHIDRQPNAYGGIVPVRYHVTDFNGQSMMRLGR